jgi:hypothetical protein
MMTRLLRRDLVLGLALLSLTVFAAPVEPEPGANVYVLQMRSGFDLHLANQLTQMGALTVVTDPALAQYVLSDPRKMGPDQWWMPTPTRRAGRHPLQGAKETSFL